MFADAPPFGVFLPEHVRRPARILADPPPDLDEPALHRTVGNGTVALEHVLTHGVQVLERVLAPHRSAVGTRPHLIAVRQSVTLAHGLTARETHHEPGRDR